MIIGARFVSSAVTGPSQFSVVLRLTRDGVTWFDNTFQTSGATAVAVRDDLTRQVVAMNASETTKDVLATIPADFPIPTTFDPPPADPDPAFTTWLAALRKFSKVKATLVDTGIVVANDVAYVALKNTVVSGLQVGYFDKL